MDMPWSDSTPVDGTHPVRPLRSSTVVCVAIVVITGAFHIYRGVPREAYLFFAVAALIALAGNRLVPTPRARSVWVPSPLASLPLAVAAAAAWTLLPVRSTGQGVLLGAIGVTVLAVGWVQGDADAAVPGPIRRTAAVWIGLGVALCLWELAAYLVAQWRGNEDAFPTISVLVDPIVEIPLYRAVLLTLWLILGLALVRWSQSGPSRAGSGAPC
jgi:hypothetical protein